MKIIEGMKELKLIEKKVAHNCSLLQRYSSMASTDSTSFPTVAEQKAKVKELVQANTDLVDRYMFLKGKIEQTNLVTKIPVMGKEYTLSQILVLKRKASTMLNSTYAALNTTYAETRIKSAQKDTDGKPPVIVRMFDEDLRNRNMNDLMQFQSEIDAKLEVVNAVTELVE